MPIALSFLDKTQQAEMHYPQRHLLNRSEHSSHHWCIVRHLSNFQSIVLTQFSSRVEAEARVQFLNRIHPAASYEVVFDESAIASPDTWSQKDAEYQDF